MFVQANNLKDIKAYYSRELSELYSESELRQIIKQLTLKRFKISNSEYLLFSNQLLSESDLLYYHHALKRLRNHEPFQHVLGEVEFYGLLLKSDNQALVPRPETEELVDWIRNDFSISKNPVILDLCSGSGCIAFALKSVFPEGKIMAAELSEGALGLIRENVTFTGLPLEIYSMDVLNPEAYKVFPEETVDCVVSNPPYIPEKDKQLMEKNVLEYEPHMALFVEDDDPLLFYREIARNSYSVLKDQGQLFFEIHEDLSLPVSEVLSAFGFVNIEVRKDLQGKDRMVRAQKVSSQHERK